MNLRDEIEAIRDSGRDAGTAEAIAKTHRDAEPRLLLMGWIERIPGADGLGCWDRPSSRPVVEPGLRLIHSIARCEGEIWSHVSVSRSDRRMPTWEQTRDVFRLVHPHEYGIIVVAPVENHVNIAEVAHVWACLSRPYVPDFTHGLATI